MSVLICILVYNGTIIYDFFYAFSTSLYWEECQKHCNDVLRMGRHKYREESFLRNSRSRLVMERILNEK